MFYDDRAILIQGNDNEDEEDRFVVMGVSATLRMLVVCHGYRERDALIRIVSARKANRYERQDYEHMWRR